MLNHAKLAHKLHAIADQLFANNTHEYAILKAVWERIVADATFVHKVRGVSAPWPVPSWTESLDTTYDVQPYTDPHTVLSVDGSQIYPDRHANVSCYVINIGSVVIPYGWQSRVVLDSEPFVFHGQENLFESMTPKEIVNARRQALELQAGLELAQKYTHAATPTVLLYDGSLIFWHLAVHQESTRRLLMCEYLATIAELQKQNTVCAWYISAPKSKELINLVRLQLCDFIPERTELYECTNTFVDTSVVQLFLKPYQRSILFKNNAPVSSEYPPSLHPYFFYIHVGDEIGRVEIPAWIAHDPKLVAYTASVVLDQCIKGQGYPVVLAEAHEQAVVKGADRDMFYHIVHKVGMGHNRIQTTSKKSFKKRSMNV